MNNHDQIEVAKQNLQKLFDAENSNLWAIGDELNRIVALGAKLKDIADEFKQSYPRLSQIASTAKAYAAAERDLALPFYTYEVARKTAKQVAREVTVRTQKPAAPQYAEALKHLKNAKNVTTQRKATKSFAAQERQKVAPVEQQRAVIAAAANAGHLDTCIHGDIVEQLERIADGSAAMIALDPPYGQYRKLPSGKLDHATSAAEVEGDNLDGASALRVTVAALKASATKIGQNGVIILWQAGYELRAAILEAIEDAGLEIEIPVIWNKGRPQPQDLNDAWAQQIEIAWIIKRKGGEVFEHDTGLTRGNIIDFAPVRMNAASFAPQHMFQKPVEMMEFLVRKHTSPNDIVVDGFGCTGSMSVACINLGRRWVYVESYANNFAIGQARIAAALKSQEQVA